MIKFGMSDYEVNQNIIGVVIGNFVVYGFAFGAGVTVAVGGLIYAATRMF